MKLRRLELSGFKSFADPVEIRVGAGATATMAIVTGDKPYTYIYTDPATIPAAANITTVAAIGPVTAAAAAELGIKTTVIPETYTVDGLVRALVRYFEQVRR